MNRRIRIVGLASLIALATMSMEVAGQQRGSSLSDQQVSDLLRRVDASITAFGESVDRSGGRNRSGSSRADLERSVKELLQATDRLREPRQTRRGDGTGGVADLLRRAAAVDSLVAGQSLGAPVERAWREARRDLDELARAYNLASDWSSTPGSARDQRRASRDPLTGTYQLDTSRPNESERVVRQAVRQLRPNQRQAAQERLMNRLHAPDTIAIDRDRTTVTMASSRGRRVTFDADGQVQREQGRGGGTIETRAVLTGDELAVTTTGSRGSDFSVTLVPMENGRSLQVTRSIQDDTLQRPVSVVSYYRKSSDAPNWEMDAAGPTAASRRNSPADDLGVPDGTRLVGTLDSSLNTRTSNAEDRFTITTTSPSQFEGAVLEGTISNVNASGRVGGRAEMALNFERIRLRNGRTYQFAGAIESVRSVDGETIGVAGDGAVEDASQTQKTVQRGAIGAALGAIIGAISGGGQGAAIGAAIGAGGGAGTVIAQGRDQLELPRGTEFTILAGERGVERTGRDR
jgi:hypothetical protein